MKNILLLLSILFLFSCADQRPPSGGDKDTTPPKAKKIVPENYTTNFHFNKIEISFDEFIKFNPNGGNIIISPTLNKKPKFELFGKKVRITFQEMLENNTTYIINFGNSIKDYNEGNELKNFKYIFSTGTFIDSLKVSGKVLDAFDNTPVSNILVGLYPENEDSFLYKKPSYLIKTNEKGEYSIENIKEGNYRIAALEDKNLNFIFDQESERVAFNNKIIRVNKNIKDLNLFLFSSIKETKIKDYNNKEVNHIIFNFTKPISKLQLDISTYNKNDIFYYSLDKKQFHYYYNNTDSSTTDFFFTIDNIHKDTVSLKLKNSTENKEISYKTSSIISNNKNLILLEFSKPISNFDTDKLSLNNTNNFLKYSYTWQDNNKTLEIETENKEDSIIISTKKDCFTSFNNIHSKEKTDTLFNFKEKYSSLTIKIKPQEHLVLELYNSNKELINIQIVSRETIKINKLKKGKYFLRIYEDLNNDMIWNSGMFHVKQQAEKTLIYKEVEIKENWDNEIDIKL